MIHPPIYRASTNQTKCVYQLASAAFLLNMYKVAYTICRKIATVTKLMDTVLYYHEENCG